MRKRHLAVLANLAMPDPNKDKVAKVNKDMKQDVLNDLKDIAKDPSTSKEEMQSLIDKMGLHEEVEASRKKYRNKATGQVVTASSMEEAKAKFKVMAKEGKQLTVAERKVLKEAGFAMLNGQLTGAELNIRVHKQGNTLFIDVNHDYEHTAENVEELKQVLRNIIKLA